MTDISYKLANIRAKIEQLAIESGRKATETELLAVSKGHDYSKVLAAFQAGQRHFAENYLQDALPKIAQANADQLDITWHFIGQIQSNKTRAIAENFSWCHSLSSLKHAQRLNQHRLKSGLEALNVCVQVQFEDKRARNGIEFQAVKPFLNKLKEFKLLNIRGLMCVMPQDWQGPELEAAYQQLQSFFLKLKLDYPQFDTLSCGMSKDYALAIKYGSSMLRLGTAIFGARN